LVHPDGAAVVSSTRLAATKAGGAASPVATAFSYGKGRLVYVGFTFENLASTDLAPAFQELIAATGLTTSSAAPIASTPPLKTKLPVAGVPVKAGTLTAVAPAPVEPPPAATPDTTSTATNTPPPAAVPEYYVVRSMKIRIYTGNDNKEALSTGTIRLYRNGGDVNPFPEIAQEYERRNPNHLTPIGGGPTGIPATELAVNSVYETKLEYTPDMSYGMTLHSCQQYGLRLDIHYDPNFFLDAWRINRVELEIDFGYEDHIRRDNGEVVYFWKSAPGFPKVIPFINGVLLNNANKDISFFTDGFFMPK